MSKNCKHDIEFQYPYRVCKDCGAVEPFKEWYENDGNGNLVRRERIVSR